jgi:hypothetical protein
MSKKNRKQKIGHNKKDMATREQKRLHSLAELAGTIIDKEKESKLTGNLEDLTPEDLRAEADRMVEGLPKKEPDAWNGW